MTTPTPTSSVAVGVRRLDAYTRSSLYLLPVFEPLAALVPVTSARSWPASDVWLVVAAMAVLAHTGSCLAVVHLGIGGSLRRSTATRRAAVALGVTTAAVLVLGLTILPPYDPDSPADSLFAIDPRTFWIAWAAAFTLGALASRFTVRWLGAGVVVTGLLILAVRLPADPPPVAGSVVVAVLACCVPTFWAGTMRLSVWSLEVIRELDAARQVSARLAVAEERLRISRDMHDVVGRALSAVAVKSELAAALARRGDPRAADEMDSVRALAQESQREVRGVVAGYRAADLATELAGARSVLRAAGIRARVVGDVPPLSASQAEALAWVVRESVTNVVRHSEAGECVLRLDVEDGTAVLRVTNDGVGDAVVATSGGNGLAGLRERLAAVGGTLDVDRADGRFTLTARLPGPDRRDDT